MNLLVQTRHDISLRIKIRSMSKTLSTLNYVLLLLLMSCGPSIEQEVGRLAINGISAVEGYPLIDGITLNLRENDVISLWSDMDIEYEGEFELRFAIEISKSGATTSRIEIDPFIKSNTQNEKYNTQGTMTRWEFKGKNKEIIIDQTGEYLIKGMLISSENAKVTVNKAEVIIKK